MNNNYVLLNNVEHKDTRVITSRGAQYGDDVNFALTFPLEFRNLQSVYPIFIRKDANTGEFLPIVLFGFEDRENLYLGDEGWNAHYIPLMIRRHPFVIGTQQSQDPGREPQHVVSIDMNSPRVGEKEGERLFLEHGGTSEYLNSVTEMLETIRLASDMNSGFIAALLEFELIESVSVQVKLTDGSMNELIGYYTINEEKLQQLDGAALHKLHENAYLESIYMMIASLACFRTLVTRKNEMVADSAA